MGLVSTVQRCVISNADSSENGNVTIVEKKRQIIKNFFATMNVTVKWWRVNPAHAPGLGASVAVRISLGH